MKNLHYLFVLTLLFSIMYSCKTDSIDACDVNCYKCIIKTSKTYDENNELNKEISYEYDDYFNPTKAKTIRYSKGTILSTEIIEYENIYTDKLLVKTTQRVNGQINTTTIYSYHFNGKVKRTEKINKDNITFSIDETNDSGKSVYYFYRKPPGELIELKRTYDSKNNELSHDQFVDGDKIYSSVSEYNTDNSFSRNTEHYNYKNEKPYSRTSIYNHDLPNKTTEINYQYLPSRVDIDKTVHKTSIDKSKVAKIDYLGKNIQYQEITDYNEKGSVIKVSSSTLYNPLVLEVRQENNYFPSGKLKQIILTVNGKDSKYISLVYDENGNEISVESWNASKMIIQKTLSTYSCVK